jgi:hypothetical protein
MVCIHIHFGQTIKWRHHISTHTSRTNIETVSPILDINYFYPVFSVSPSLAWTDRERSGFTVQKRSKSTAASFSCICLMCKTMTTTTNHDMQWTKQIYYNGFDQTIARQQLCKHVQTRNNRGMSSLLSSDSVNILAAANASNNNEYIVISCYWAIER